MDDLKEKELNISQGLQGVLPPDLSLEPEVKDGYRFKKCLIAITGVPASGKTTLGTVLADNSNLLLLDVDQTRRRLFGNHGLLDPEQERSEMERSYLENHQLAEAALRQNHPVILVATYAREFYHAQLKELAEKTNVPFKVIQLSIEDDQTVIPRLEERRNDSSTFSNITTYESYLGVKKRFKSISGVRTRVIDSSHPLPTVYQDALAFLSDLIVSGN